MGEDKILAGIIGQKTVERAENRKRHLEKKEEGRTERNSRRRTVFDFDLWDAEDKVSQPSQDWVGEDVLTHTAQGRDHCQYIPKAAAVRNFSTGTTLPAVEVPDSGASYNPSAKDHQDLLWKAAMVEIQKQKEQDRIQRQTTAMFPTQAPTQTDYLQEMSEGIVELKQEDKAEEEKEEKEEKEDSMENDSEKELSSCNVVRPKTRKQKRDKRGRMFEKQREQREKETKLREMELMRTKSLRKQLKKEENKNGGKSEKESSGKD